MRREPALHIKFKDLVRILTEQGVDTPDELALKIFTEGIKVAVQGRAVVTGGRTVKEDAAKKIAAAKYSDEISLQRFNTLLYAAKRDANKYYPMKNSDNDPASIHTKEILQVAIKYAKAFDFTSIEEGCKVFIATGIELMGKNYRLLGFKSTNMIDKIYLRTKAISRKIKEEELGEIGKTEQYIKTLNAICGQVYDVYDMVTTAEDWYYCSLARRQADKHNADYASWVKAHIYVGRKMGQGIVLKFMYGDMSYDNYKAYMMAKKLKQKETSKEDTPAIPVKQFKGSFQDRYESAKKNRA